MINLSFNGQELTEEEFMSFSSKEKHAYAEEKMGNRIILSYNQALKESRSIIDSDEKLTRAFQNFQEKKNLLPTQVPEEVLRGAFVDKFKERIFFVISENDELSHYIYDIPSRQLLNYAINGEPLNNLPVDLSNLNKIRFNHRIEITLEESWRNSQLSQYIVNPNALNDDCTNNQEYVNDNHYPHINKFFKPIDSYKEINQFHRVYFASISNPAHTTIDPEDLINFKRMTSTKNARNI